MSEIENARLDICHVCPFCIARTKCKRVQELTRGEGYLYHSLGVSNMMTGCPEGKWKGITPLHAWYLNEYLIPNFKTEKVKLFRRIRRSGLTYARADLIASLLSEDLQERIFLEGVIISLRTYPNDYAHLVRINPPYLSDDDCVFSFDRIH